MKAKSEYPTRHGDQHLPWGSDPIPDSSTAAGPVLFTRVVAWGGSNTISAAAAINVPTRITVDFDNIDIDDDSMWSAGAPDRLTVQTAGVYGINISAFPAASGAPPATYSYTIDVARDTWADWTIPSSGGYWQGGYFDPNFQVQVSSFFVDQFQVGDYVEMGVSSNWTGGSTDVEPCVMAMVRLGDIA